MSLRPSHAAALLVALAACIDVNDLVFDLGEGGAGLGGGSGGTPLEGGAPAGPTYFDVVMADAPSGYWRFDEESSAEAVDSSGNGHHALSVDGDGAVARNIIGALFSDDPDSGIELTDGAYVILSPNPFELAGLSPYTLEVWVEVISTSQPVTVFRWLETDPTNAGMQTILFPDSAYHKRYDGLGGLDELMELPTVLGNGYHHLVVTFDGADAFLYIDGALVTAPDPPDFLLELPDLGGALELGYSGAGTTLRLDELALYDYPLEVTRVEAHYACGFEASCL